MEIACAEDLVLMNPRAGVNQHIACQYGRYKKINNLKNFSLVDY